MNRYSLIYADPAWSYGNQISNGAAVDHYPTMSLLDMKRLPVWELAADTSRCRTQTSLFSRPSLIVRRYRLCWEGFQGLLSGENADTGSKKAPLSLPLPRELIRGKGGSSIAIAMLCASSPRRGLLSRRMTEYGQQGDRALLAAHANSCAGHRLQGRRLVYDLVPFQIREA